MAKCKVCGNELVKKKTKTGEVVLYCTDCKKIYRLKAKAEEAAKKVEEEEEEEEEEAPAAVAPKKIPAKKAPVVEEEDDEEEEEEAPKAAPIPEVKKEEPKKEEKAAPAPVAPIIAAPEVDNKSIASIAASLAEINDSLKSLLKIFNNIYKS